MKAFMWEEYGLPEALRMAEVEKPVPKADQVLVRVLAVSVNPVDWHSMRGNSRATLGLVRPKHEILGVDVAGQVEAVGGGVTRFEPGTKSTPISWTRATAALPSTSGTSCRRSRRTCHSRKRRQFRWRG